MMVRSVVIPAKEEIQRVRTTRSVTNSHLSQTTFLDSRSARMTAVVAEASR